ncbi:hypothetical protein ETU10_06600 [Apibacter muscae]|uniref:hypothetical protein n=1 Tax=Apibacter muscae TaxID=2509004 RepID=UPI0011AC520A|nr:hypothetical protein [Apibacter muscae]TWP23394.1 hypothetical protein ETU10_06600 [Apibacter muscae]
MKRILFLFACFSFIIAQSQKITSISTDFKLDSLLFPDMVTPAKIYTQLDNGNINNLSVITNPSLICSLFKVDCKNVKKIYLENYQDRNSGSESGVLVAEYKDIKSLDTALNKLLANKQKGYLTKENYLIQVWSNDPKHGEEEIIKMENFYQNKIMAKLYVAEEIYPTEVLPGE